MAPAFANHSCDDMTDTIKLSQTSTRFKRLLQMCKSDEDRLNLQAYAQEQGITEDDDIWFALMQNRQTLDLVLGNMTEVLVNEETQAAIAKTLIKTVRKVSNTTVRDITIKAIRDQKLATTNDVNKLMQSTKEASKAKLYCFVGGTLFGVGLTLIITLMPRLIN